MKQFKYIQNVATISLDRDSCVGCRMCLNVCPHEVFEITDRKAAIHKQNDCMECGACSQNCPTEAITLDPGVGCAALILSRWMAKIGIKTSGCC